MKLTRILGLVLLMSIPFFFSSCIILSNEQMWKIEWDENATVSDDLVIWNQTTETVSIKVKFQVDQAKEPDWSSADHSATGVAANGTFKINGLSLGTDEQIWIKVTSESANSGYFAVGSHTFNGALEENIQAIVHNK